MGECSAVNTCLMYDFIWLDESRWICFSYQLERFLKAAWWEGGGRRWNRGNILNVGWPICNQRQDCSKFWVPEGYLCLTHDSQPQGESLQHWLTMAPWKSVRNWAVTRDRHCADTDPSRHPGYMPNFPILRSTGKYSIKPLLAQKVNKSKKSQSIQGSFKDWSQQCQGSLTGTQMVGCRHLPKVPGDIA